uniref:Uncharacterized protein n=1 Tax=Seriola lalandi dorsalis TaxID=1841481 RepID=A0A3B4X9J3_SERLL
MSSEEFEKMHEIYRSLYEELKLIPDRALKSHGGKHCVLLLLLLSSYFCPTDQHDR